MNININININLIILTFLINIISSQNIDPYCSNGLISKNVCCDSICGQCGEEGCSNGNVTIGDLCCIDNIRNTSISCDISTAPCVITDDKLPVSVEESTNNNTLSLFIIIIIIVSVLVLCLFINTGSNRKFTNFGHINNQRANFLKSLDH